MGYTCAEYYGRDIRRYVQGQSLKSKSGWLSGYNNRNDGSEFAAYPVGPYDQGFLTLDPMGEVANFWTSTEQLTNSAWIRLLGVADNRIFRVSKFKSIGLSCRCVKD